jgi:hypothetical protein
MGKGWIKWVGGLAISALANCLAGHLIGCVFERVGLSCPRNGAV